MTNVVNTKGKYYTIVPSKAPPTHCLAFRFCIQTP